MPASDDLAVADATSDAIADLGSEFAGGIVAMEYDRCRLPNEGSELWPINAWHDLGIGISVLDLKLGLVIMENGVVLPIVGMRDADGFAVEEWEDCVRYDFGNPSVGYGSANSSTSVVKVH